MRSHVMLQASIVSKHYQNIFTTVRYVHSPNALHGVYWRTKTFCYIRLKILLSIFWCPSTSCFTSPILRKVYHMHDL